MMILNILDGEHISQPAEITIQILSVNDLPIFSSSALDIMEGTHFNYTMSIDDVDGDQVSVSVPTKPNWLTINDVNSNSLFNGNDCKFILTKSRYRRDDHRSLGIDR